MENARKNKLSCSKYIPCYRPSGSEADIHFMMLLPLHVFLVSLSSQLPHKLTCIHARSQQLFLLWWIVYLQTKTKTNKIKFHGFMLLKYFVSGTFD